MSSGATEAEPPLAIAGRLRYVPGYTHGMRYPSLVATVAVRGEPGELPWLDDVDSRIVLTPVQGAVLAGPEVRDAQHPLLAALLRVLDRVQRATGVPVMAPGIVTGFEGVRATVRIPVLRRQHAAVGALLKWTLELFRLLASGLSTDGHVLLLRGVLDEFRSASFGANHPRFLRNAHSMGVPFLELPGAVMQYGQGARGRWFESSFTDRTSRIGTQFARNKMLAANMLRQAGIPASRQVLAGDAAAALRAAEAIGYPVVVKPLDTDGGVGVSTGLRSAAAVERAFALA
ncbi:MAG: hypothetical protein JNL61_17195, partial [Rhizobiaceae bacterium]|nr:hypothetical protein [Rhizobiaceae bacterium]